MGSTSPTSYTPVCIPFVPAFARRSTNTEMHIEAEVLCPLPLASLPIRSRKVEWDVVLSKSMRSRHALGLS